MGFRTAEEEIEWQNKRKEGIGGSDVAAILGMSAWKTPLKLYQLKVGEIEDEPAGEAADRGTKMEPEIVRLFTERTGLEVGPGDEFLRHPRWPEVPIQANTDGTILQPDGKPPGILECKTAGEMTQSALNFENGRLPTAYALQVQAYLAVTGYRWGALAAMIGPRYDFDWKPDQCRLKILSFRPNPEVIQMIEEVCADFWRCVVNRTPPAYRRHPKTNHLLLALEDTPVRLVGL